MKWQLGLDRVLLVPCLRSPHKPDGHRFGAELRLQMVEAAVADHPGLSASRIELDREPPSYSVDTLAHLAAEERDAALWLIVGADQLMAFSSWRQPRRILELARLAAVDRGPAVDLPDDIDSSRVDRVSMPRIDVSSSEIRRRLEAGAPVAHLVPRGVREILSPAGA